MTTLKVSRCVCCNEPLNGAYLLRPPGVCFAIPGAAAPQGSKRHVGHGILVESSKAVGPWRERVALVARDAMAGAPLLLGPVVVEIGFVLPRPTSYPKRKFRPAITRPDVDKLARAILDAITLVVIGSDAQVTTLIASKRLAAFGEPPATNVEIRPAAQ